MLGSAYYVCITCHGPRAMDIYPRNVHVKLSIPQNYCVIVEKPFKKNWKRYLSI